MTLHQPSSQRELTVRVVFLGVLLSVVMGAANVYVGLKVGMTVSASIPAAVMAMIVFRLLPLRGTVLEANQVQTSASAGESLAAGIIFTMPALVMMGHWDSFDFWTVTAVAFAGGLLGILFMIPMRRVFVVDSPNLPYPEGVACAAVLETGASEEGDDLGARALITGGVVGAAFKFLAGYLALFRESLEAAAAAASRVFYFGSNISPMLVAVGLIVRLNVAVLIFIGGALSWLIALPLLGLPETGGTPLEMAKAIGKSDLRYIGVGAMVVGGVVSIVSIRRGLVAAVRELLSAGKRGEAGDERSRDLPRGVIVGLGLVSVALIGWIYYHFTGGVGITVVSTVVMIVMAFFFTAVASYIVGLVGNSNSPVSGMTITTVLFTGAMFLVFGFSGTQGMVAILGVAAVVCCVACTSGDVCNDLKTGSLVGAAPFRQQWMQILGVLVAAFVMAPVLNLLHQNTPGGIGGDLLPAPQAGLFRSLAEGFFSEEAALPWSLIQIGVAVGVVLLLLDLRLKSTGSGFRLHVMPVAVGMYLPFTIATPILIGGLIAHFATRGVSSQGERERVLHRGVLFGSGVIAGEALTGVGLAGLAALGAVALDPWLPAGVIVALTLAAALAVLWGFVRMARPVS